MTIPLQSGGIYLPGGTQGAPSFPAVAATLIYSAAAYSAFPRALKLSDGSGYLIAFKAGVSHVGAGNAVVLHSSDFSTWTTRAALSGSVEGKDASMDNWMCHTPDGRIQMLCRYLPVPSIKRVRYSSDNGVTWTSPADYGNNDAAFNQIVIGSNLFTAVYSQSSGYTKLIRWTGDTTVEDYATISTAPADAEPAVGIGPDGIAVAHIRHGTDGAISSIYTAPAPYTTWTHRLDWHPWHGQVIRAAPDGTLWGLGRWFQKPTAAAGAAITAVIRYDGHAPRVVAYLPPLSANWGNVGYGDLVWVGSEEYPRAVYYAEGGTACAIFTATITGAA